MRLLTNLFMRKYGFLKSNVSTCVNRHGFSSSQSLWTNGTVSLSYDHLPGSSKAPPIIISHGLLGNRKNWRSIGKALNKNTSRDIYLLDARNHGLSPHADDLDYIIMGQDLIQFLDDRGLAEATLVGHSMGGRASMAATLNNPDRVASLFVLDISPYGVSETVSSLPIFVSVMMRMNLDTSLTLQRGRKEAEELLTPVVPDIGIRQFLLTNLYKDSSDGTFKWRANLDSISRHFNPHICTFPLEECGEVYSGPTCFVKGANSDYIKSSEYEDIRVLFPSAQFLSLEGAGHWLHADKPKEFIAMMTQLLQ